MSNKTIHIPRDIKIKLDDIVKNQGIEVLEDYIKLYKKQKRKEMKKYNTKYEVAYDVYNLMFNQGYDKTPAMEEISKKRNVTFYTIRNHISNFDKEAKNNNFFIYGGIIECFYDYDMMNDLNNWFEFKNILLSLAKANNLEDNILEIYFWKYKTLIKKEKEKYKIDFDSVIKSKIIIPEMVKKFIPDEWLNPF